jgi:hypothetical protein
MVVGKMAAACAALGAFVLWSAPARAAVLTIPFGQEYTSGAVPSGPGPWVTATFDDHGSSGSVTLTISSALSGSMEFISRVLFNFDPALNPAALSFSAPTKVGVFADPAISAGANAFSAGGGSNFDLLVQFDNSPPVNRFNGSDSVSFTITGVAGLTAGSFNFSSTAAGGTGPLPASAHIQGVGQSSAWVSVVPEPASASVLLLSLTGLLARRPRRS